MKFRQVSDLSTPSKKGSKAPAFSVLTPTPASTPLTTPIEPPPPVSIFRKSERNLLEKKSRDEKYIEKLKVDIDDLNKKLALLHLQNAQRVDEIDDLNNDIDNMEVAEEFLEKIAAQAINKISESDEKVKEILHNYDILLHHMDRMSCENENLLELNANLTTSNDEFTKLNEERIHEMEKKLKVKSDELLRMRQKVIERNTVSKHFEFELGKKTMENYGLNVKLEKSVENFKIFEVQHEENMKMLKNSYETEIFFLHTKLSNTQIQLTKIAKNQKRMHSMDMESQIDFENQKKSFEMEKKKFNIAFKEYETIIEVLSKRLRESDTGVEVVMAENKELKSEIATLRLNYEKLRISAENLKKNFDDKNKLFEQLMSSSEMEMMTMVSKMNDYFNEKFSEIAELKKSFDIRDKNLKKMTSTILEEYTIGIELARLELDDKQKKIVDYENEIKTIKLENLQLKMKLSESNSHKTATLETIEEETATDDEKKNIQEREEENQQLKSKVKNRTANLFDGKINRECFSFTKTS